MGNCLLCTVILLNLTGLSSLRIGNPCTIEEDCYDVRLRCLNSTCMCSWFYFWDDELGDCNLNQTELRIWLYDLREEIDLSDKLVREAVRVYYHLSFAGILALILGFCGGLSCVVFFCVFKPRTKPESVSQEISRSKVEDPGAMFIPPAANFEAIV